jgi:YMGG-like Gly-zipper
MKQIMFTLTAAVIFLTACNSEKKNPLDYEKRIVFTDTSLLRTSNSSTDKVANGETLAPQTTNDNTKPKVVTVTKYVRVVEKQQAPRRRSNRSQQQSSSQSNGSDDSAPNAGATTGGGNDGGAVATAPEAVVNKKKGWSKAAKGATIGGVGGAVAGAVISKNKGKGAIIGGVIGAAGGYILGRRADKKSGRANYTQK